MADKTLTKPEDTQQFQASELSPDSKERLHAYFDKINEMAAKLSSDDPHEQAEGFLQTYLYSKTNSFTAPDDAEFGSCINDLAERIKSDSSFQDTLKEKYGDPVPPAILNAGVLGFVDAAKDNEDMKEIANGMLAGRKMTSDFPSSYEELKASITDKALLADVEASYERGQTGAETMAKATRYINEIATPKYTSFLSDPDGETIVKHTHNPFYDATEQETLEITPKDYGSILDNLPSDSSVEDIEDALCSILFNETGSTDIPNQERFDMLVHDIANDKGAVRAINAEMDVKYGDNLPKEIIHAKAMTGSVDYDDPKYAAYVNDPEFNRFFSSDSFVPSIKDPDLRADVERVIAAGHDHNMRAFNITEAIDEMVFEARYGIEAPGSIKSDFNAASGTLPCDEHTLDEAKNDMGIKNSGDDLGAPENKPDLADPIMKQSF